jgi:C4-dicarboxylate transporter DctM subunit
MLIFVLIAIFIALVVIGVPIAFAMGLGSLAFLVAEGNLSLALIVQRLFSGIDSFPLMAVPFFIFAGLLMDTGGSRRGWWRCRGRSSAMSAAASRMS